MCKKTSTLQRVIFSLRQMTAGEREHVRRELNAAPEAPSLRDAIQKHRGESPTTDLRTALQPKEVK